MMQPSTWNDENQHWIPQFLLKGFGIQGRRSRVYEMDRETGQINIVKVAEAASKQLLLTDLDDSVLRRIESHPSRAVGMIRKGRIVDITQEGRQALDDLVFAMIVNDPHGAIDRAKARADVIGDQSDKLQAALLRHGGYMDHQGLRDLLDESMQYNYLSMSFDHSESLVRKMLRYMRLSVRQATDDESFVIGDSPVLAIRNPVNGQASLSNPDSQVVLPVSNKTVLVYDWATPIHLIDHGPKLEREQVRSLNRDYYHKSNSRYIYGSTRGSLECSQRVQMLWLPQKRSVQVNDGWWIMQEELQKAQGEWVAADAEGVRDYDFVARELVRAAQAAADSPASEDTE